jgi:hypothetical protein
MATNEVPIQVPALIGTPGAIGSLAVIQADNSISLSWTEPDLNGSAFVAYHVYRGTESDASDRVEIGQSTGPSYIDLNVERGEKYYYWVLAENGNGMGVMSAPTAATASSDGMGQIPLWVILLIIGIIAASCAIVLLIARRSKAQSRRGGASSPTLKGGTYPQTIPTRCPNCGSPVENMLFCGNCGRRLT